MKRRWLIAWLILSSGMPVLNAQSNLREKIFPLKNDTISLDSLSIIPSSFEIFILNEDRLPDSLYSINWVEALLIPSLQLIEETDSILVRYRVFPLRFNKTYRYLADGQNRIDPVRKNSLLTGSSPKDKPWQRSSSLYTSGNLSRGIQVGNNQDASLNSNLNLQLSGKINEQFTIEAQLSDANIPIQPEGNTQQIQEFDRVSIRIYNSKTQLLAGDFTLDSPEGYFQKMNKNLQGLQLKTSIVTGKHDNQTYQTRSTAAIVKGKFNRMKIQGSEGNQGPYRLIGKEGEQYIQVIAGSEQVYVDGLPLKRGENEDYVINYNTAELSFTSKNLITKDKRITVQFEYTDRSYTRFVVSSDNQWSIGNALVYLNIYSESDAKNQPILQDLSEEQKSFLSTIGDQLDQARVNNYYETNFQNDRVLYKMIDSLVNGIRYPNVLVYSTHPDSANYQAGFSQVGTNMGNYKAIQTSANGQVYKWVAPENGVPQGDYEPITRLITPKRKQIYSLGAIAPIGQHMSLKTELSLSSNDMNTFSPLDRNDNQGSGVLSRLDRQDRLGKDSTFILNSFISFRRVGKNYDALEPFNPVEFERDWNLIEQVPDASETYLQSGFNLIGKDSLSANYAFDWLSYSQNYSGLKHASYGQVYLSDFKIQWTGSYLLSDDAFRNTSFLRHEIQVTKDIKWLRLKVKERQEGNQWTSGQSISLQEGSFKFQEWITELSPAGNKANPWFIKLLMRNDYSPDSSAFSKDFQALEASTGLKLKGTPGQSSSFSVNWRKLENKGSSSPILKDENTATIRAEEQFQISQGAVVSRSFYEIGSGLERKQDFYYLEVPQGQGYYTWTDYNGNNNKELDEFEPAVFTDLANYIRVFRLGNEYVPVYTNRFTQTLSLNPYRFVKSEDSKARFLRLFSDQFSFSTHRRNQRVDFLSNLNPLFMADSLLVSLQSQMRNSLSLNTPDRKFGTDYLIQRSINQNLMTYGTDYRENQSQTLVSRVHLIDRLWINNQLEKGFTKYESSFFTTRNYAIDYWRNALSITLETTDNLRINTDWNWGSEKNEDGIERVIQQQLEIGADYQSTGKGMVHLDIQYIHLAFIGEENNPVGYVMLKGFRPGHNGTANLSIRRKLNEVIQLDINYGARFSQNSKLIHTGNVAVRAVF